MGWLKQLCERESLHSATGMDLVAESMLRAGLDYRQSMAIFSRVYLLRSAMQCKGNANAAARKTGLHRNTFKRLCESAGLAPGKDVVR